LSLKKNEKLRDKIIKKHLRQKEDKLLRAYKRSLTNIRREIMLYYEKYQIEGMLPTGRIHRMRATKALARNIEKEIAILQGKEVKIIDKGINEVYKHSYYRTGHALETTIGGDLGFDIVNPKIVDAVVADKMSLIKWPDASKDNAKLLIKRIKGIVEQGIIQGTPLQEVSRQVKEQMGIGASKSIRIIRTETGRCQNEGTIKGYDEAQAEGVEIVRVWLASLDDRTRDTHRSMDKQEADPKTNLFTLPGGAVTRGPHLSGIAAEDINCRCAVTAQISEMPAEVRAARDPVTGKSINIKNMTYAQWAKVKNIKKYKIAG